MTGLGEMAISYELWGASRTERLSSARSLASDELSAIHDNLRRGRTDPGWPYGSATSINPLLVILGASPGNSPKRDDRHFVTREPFEPPTAGKPHSGVFYSDSTGYWDKVKVLARILLDADGSLGDDALALFGTMNLATVASASASDVQIDDAFARWVLATIRDGLRPRVLVLLGLRGRLKELSRLFADIFEGFDVRHPHHEYALEKYQAKRLVFREWEFPGNHGSPLLLVDWPQHPSRSPFSDPRWWRAACEQFAARRSSLIE